MFGKKKSKGSENIQELNMQFNQAIYKIGGAQYRKALLNKQLGEVSNELVAFQKESEALAVKIQSIQIKMQQEMKAKIDQGADSAEKADESSKAQG